MPENDIQIRSNDISDLKVNVAARTVSGYAAVFNSLSKDLGGFKEVIRPGSFQRSIQANSDVRATYNHGTLLGRTASGTLKLNEDARGLAFELQLPDTT